MLSNNFIVFYLSFKLDWKPIERGTEKKRDSNKRQKGKKKEKKNKISRSCKRKLKHKTRNNTVKGGKQLENSSAILNGDATIKIL